MKKTLISVLLITAIVLTSLGMLFVSADAATMVEWSVGEDHSTLQAALTAAKEKADWLSTDQLVISVPDGAEESISVTDGMLFGISTIFREDGTRLPIEIRGGVLTLSESAATVFFTNDYTFTSTALSLGDAAVYAGAGNVCFDAVDFGTSTASLYAEAGSEAVFASWSVDAKTASAADGLIPVGLSFRNCEYDGFIGFGSASDVTTDTAASLLIADSAVQDVSLCAEKNTSAKKVSLQIEGESYVSEILGFNASSAGDFDLSVSILGAEYIESVSLVEGGTLNGNALLTVKGDVTVNEVKLTGENASVGGEVICEIASVSDAKPLIATFYGSSAADINRVLLSDGEITSFYGCAFSGADAALNLSVSGGTIGTFRGTANGAVVASVKNEITGGTVSEFYGCGTADSKIPSVSNTVAGSAVVTAFHGCDAVQVGSLSNTVSGSASVTSFAATGPASCDTVTNTFSGGTLAGDFMGAEGYVKTLINTVSENAVISGAFYGSGIAAVGNIQNNLIGGTISGNFYGTNGSADSVVNAFGVSGKHIYDTTDQLPGDGIAGVAYGTGSGTVKTVTNNLYSNLFNRIAATDIAGACFYGTGSGTVGDVTNNFMAETQTAGTQVFSGTGNSATTNVTGKVTNTNNGSATHFNAHTFYPIGHSIDGEVVTHFEYKSARRMPRLMSPVKTTKAGAMTLILKNIKGFSGQVYLINHTVAGDVHVEVENTSNGSNFIITGTIGGNLTVSMTSLTLTGTDKNRGVHATVGGNLIGTYKDVSIVDSKNDDGVFRPASAVGGTVHNTFTDFYCKLGSPLYGAYGAVGTALAADNKGTALTTIFNTDDGKVNGGSVGIANSFYGSKAAVNGSVSNTVNGYIIAGTFYGAGSTVSGNVSNTFISSETYNYFYGTTDNEVKGDIFNTLTDSVIGREKNCWFYGCFGTVASVTNIITDTYMAYCRATSYSSSARAVKGNVTNEFTNVEISGACFLTRGSTTNAVVSTTIDGGVYGDGIVAINGYCKSATTTVKGGAVMKDWVTTWNQGAGDVDNHIYLEDVVLEKGVAWVSEGKDVPASPLSKVFLAGPITIGSDTQLLGTGIKDGVDSVTLIQTGDWKNLEYLTMDSESMKKVTAIDSGAVNGYWGKATKGENTTLRGYNVDDGIMASIYLDTRVEPILWLDAGALDFYMAKENAPFTVNATMGDLELVNRSYTAKDLAPFMTVDGYYKIRLSTADASRFDDAMTVSCVIGDEKFSVNSIGLDANGDAIPFTVMNLATAGAEEYDAIISAAEEGSDVSEYILASDLFKAIYNYGASACGMKDTMLTSFSTDFYQDLADNDPKYGKQAHDAIEIKSAALLMGDALGIRLKGVLTGDASLISVAAKNGGEAIENPVYRLDAKGGALALDFYVSAESFGDELDITVSYDGTVVFRIITSMKGLTEAMYPAEAADDEDAKLVSIAQLVQACVNCSAVPPQKEIVPSDYVSDNVFTQELKNHEAVKGVFNESFYIDVNSQDFLENIWVLNCDAYYTATPGASVPTVQIKLVNSNGSTLYYSMPYQIGGSEDYVTREWRVPPIRSVYNTVRLIFDIPEGVTLSIHDLKQKENVHYETEYDHLKFHAHQGFSGYTSSSSADSFEQAGIMGYKSCITIPKFTADGVGVCFHDDDSIRKLLRYDDGSTIAEGSEDDKPISEFTYEELMKFDVGLKKSSIYKGQDVCTLDEFFRICAKYDMDPIFSVHPDLTEDQWLYVKDLLEKYDLTHKFWIKTGRPSTQKITTKIFDDDIAGYIMIQGQSSDWDPLTQANSCGFDLTRHTVIMEYFYAAITEEKIQTALDEGFPVSVATTGDGISGEEIRRLMDLGVTEFTIDHHCSMGLNW